MRSSGGTLSARMLVACVAVLLPAGVLSATVVERPSSPRDIDRAVVLTGLGSSALLDEPATTTTAPVAVAERPSAPATTAPSTTPTTRAPASTTTTTKQVATTTSTTVPLTDPNWLTVPNLTPAGSWQTEANGVKMRLRIDPVAPVAGQPVRFFMDVSGPGLCCMVGLTFGEGSDQFMVSPQTCTPSPAFGPGVHSYVATHTYAGPGAHKARMVSVGGDMCGPPPPGVSPLSWSPQLLSGYPIDACIAVGPGSAGEAGCPRN
jgi:hypothetical protein